MAEDEVEMALRKEGLEAEEHRLRWCSDGSPGDDWEAEEVRRRS
jgi:hypothetical protein